MKELAAAVLTALLATTAHAQTQAQGLTQPGMSPIVTWDPEIVYGGSARLPTARPMTAAELKLSRERAERFFDALKSAPVFAQPERHVTHLDSWATVSPEGVLEQQSVAYWTRPADARRRADGAFWGVMGGVHKLIFIYTNRPPNAANLAEREHNAFQRQIGLGASHKGYFVEPRVYGQIGGGAVYGGYFIATRDGRPALVPATLAALLEVDIAMLKKRVADNERGFASALRELDTSMTPEAVAARRAKRAAAWAKEARGPAAMAQRLDAAARTDDADYERQKAYRTAPPTPDPRNVHWGPRLALQSLEQQLAGLDAAGRQAQACGHTDTAFPADLAVRWAAAGTGAPAGCRPMVRIRDDLIGPGKPEDVRIFIAWLGEEHCGQAFGGAPMKLARTSCPLFTPLLRDLDWVALRRSFGWKEPT
jgi:hypothetical protein